MLNFIIIIKIILEILIYKSFMNKRIIIKVNAFRASIIS